MKRPRALDGSWRWVGVVVLAFALLHGPPLARRYQPNTWLFADGAFYFATVRSIAEHGRLEQRELHPQSWYAQDLGWNRSLTDDWSNVALGRDGGWYPKHPILLPSLAVPFYLLFGPPGTLALNVLLNLAFVLLVFLLGRRLAHPAAAALVAIAVASLPFVIEMSYTFSNDLLGAVLLLGAIELALGERLRGAGLLAGLAVWSRVTNVAYLPALVVIGLSVGGWRAVWTSAKFAAIPLTAFAALNTWLFGAPWVTSYHRVIVREAGVMGTAAHTRLFNVPFARGLERILTASDGAFRSFPLLGPGLLSLAALMRTRRALALAVVLFVALPVLAYAKYDWYRPHFLYPAYGAGAVGLAALLGLLLPPHPELTFRAPPRWAWELALLAIVLASIALRPAPPDPQRLSTHLREARVQLDEIPCDYFNIQNERWECSHFDPSGWAMTGLMRGEVVRVGGARADGIWMHPNPSGRWRRIRWSRLDASRAQLTFALSDATHPGPVQVEVRPRGKDPIPFTLSKPGEKHDVDAAWLDGEGDALEIRARAAAPYWKQLVFEGALGR